jgi:hypothetical protein
LNGSRFNRWSAANFRGVGQAVEYAVAHIEALANVSPPLPECVGDLRALGFDVEGGGAGVPFLSYYAPGAGHVLITGSDGADLPEDGEWMVGVYGPGDVGELESLWTETSEEAGGTRAALLRAAERGLAAARLATPQAVEGRLTDELRAYCIANGLPPMSADELECSLSAYLDGATVSDGLHAAFAARPLARLAEARRWLQGFCRRWDAVADTHDRLHREAQPAKAEG